MKSIQINSKIYTLSELEEAIRQQTNPQWLLAVFEFIVEWYNESKFIVQHTSGSTGEPKPIQLKKSAMMASAQKTLQFFNLKENDTAWLCLPMHYIAGKMMVVRAIADNLNLIVTEAIGTPVIPNKTVDFTAMVPLQVQKLIDVGANFSSIKKLIIGGAAVDFGLMQRLQHLPTEMYATYGMTETCSHIALQRLNGDNPNEYFQLLNGVSISANTENCLTINAPELSDTSLQTNDIVEMVSEKSFRIIGRKDNVINSGGIKISPEMLEKTISEILHQECLITPKEDTLLGQHLVLVLEETSQQLSLELINNQLKNKIEKHKLPKEVFYIKQFPRTSSMKIDRKVVIKEISQLSF